jgi:hypothetical protein
MPDIGPVRTVDNKLDMIDIAARSIAKSFNGEIVLDIEPDEIY